MKFQWFILHILCIKIRNLKEKQNLKNEIEELLKNHQNVLLYNTYYNHKLNKGNKQFGNK